jgi:hypothetical protein
MSDALQITTLFLTYGKPQDLPVGRMPAQLQTALAYWLERAAGRRAPMQRDVDPFSDLPDVAPWAALWLATGDEHGYVCARAGGDFCDTVGRDMHGMTLTEVCRDGPHTVRQEFEGVAETLLAHYVERSVVWARPNGRIYARLLLPLSEDGRSASMLWTTVILL